MEYVSGSAYASGAQLRIKVSGEALNALETLRQISGAEDIESLILRAVYLYREILAEQATGATIVSRRSKGVLPLAHYVKDKRLALEFIEMAKTLSCGKDWHLFFLPPQNQP